VEDRFYAGKRVAQLGIAVNIILLAIKLTAGYAGGSQAMVADGFNSVGDVFASTATLLGSLYAAKPRDADHVWGHGKAEYIAAMIIGFAMIAMAVYTVRGAADALVSGAEIVFSWWLVGAAAVVIATKACMYAYTAARGKRYKSLLITANAKDHRNDVLVAIGTLAAILLSRTGVHMADGIVGIAISGWIIYTGVIIIRDASVILMDSNAGKDALDEYKSDIGLIPGIDHIDSIVAKPVGAQYLLIVKISVDKNMNVAESHAIAKRVETLLLEKRGAEINDVLVHINPDFPHIEA
jgi:cation diffusion facilitator family transporter